MGRIHCSPWELAFLVLVMAAMVPFVAANIVVLVHRRRRFFLAQGGALLILTSSTAGLICIATTFLSSPGLPSDHLQSCHIWRLWLQLTFGFSLWFSCQALRLIHLYYLCRNAAASIYSCRRRMLLWALPLWTPGLVFTIAATAFNAKLNGDAFAHCLLQDSWKEYAYFILPLFFFSILVVLLIYTKSEKDYMMAIEHSHTLEYSFMMVLMIYILSGASHLMKIEQEILGRCFLTFGVCCIIFINFWVRLGWPVYLCLFKRKSEMDSFEEELQSHGADCLAATRISRVARRRSFAGQNTDWIWRAIDDAMNELSECKERINGLEEKKVLLSSKIEQLEKSTRTEFMSSPLS